MFVTSAMRRMNRKAASTMPTSMATVKSTSTVSRNVVSRTATSLLGARNSAMNVRHSLMWNATTTRIAASVASGIRPAQRPKKSVINSSVIACTIPAIGVRPPFFTFVAVRAIAPVAGIPPNNGEAILAMPCATSSMLERWRPPIMPSATTADSSDSIAARSAIVKAGPARPPMIAIERCGMRGAGRPAWISPNRAPIVSTGRCSSWASAVVTISATNGPGMRVEILGHTRMIANAATAITSAHGLTVSKA